MDINLGSVTGTDVGLGYPGVYTGTGFYLTAVNTTNVISDGQAAIAVTGSQLDTVTSAIIETADSAYQADVTASWSGAVGGASATFSHSRGATPLTTASYQLRLTISDGVNTVSQNLTINPASGFQVIELAGALVLTDPESVFAPYTGPAPEVGDQYIVPLATTGGAPITANADSTLAYDYTGIVPAPDLDSHSAEYWSSNGTSRVWSSSTINIDQPPTVVEIVPTTPGTVGLGQVVSITVAIDQVVTVAGAPHLAITLDDGPRQAAYASGSGTSDLVFTYTVQEFEDAKTGVVVTALELNGGTILDAGGNGLILPIGGVALATLIVDAGPDLAPTLGTPTVTKSSISLPLSYAGTDLTGYEYQLDGGAWTDTGNPLQLSGLTADTLYSLAVRAKSATGYGPTASTTITTATATDSTPDAFAFIAQTGVALGAPVVSNSITVTGVDAGLDIPVSVSGAAYSVSTNGGADWGGATTAPTNVRLNYQIRLELVAASTHATETTATLTVGGVSATFSATTLADTVKPVIQLTGGNVEVELDSLWVEPGYTANDNADGDLTAQVVITGTVDTSALGPQTLTYSVTDAAGNSATATRIVTVVEAVQGDTVKPVLSLVGGNQQIVLGTAWAEPGYSAIDDVDGDITGSVVITGSVNTAVTGTYTLTYTATDAAGNVSTATRLVEVYAPLGLTDLAPDVRTLVCTRSRRVEMASGMFFKQPAEVLDYDFDLTDWLTAQGDTLAAGGHSVAIVGPGLTVEQEGVITGTSRYKVWLSGGSHAESYIVRLTVKTAGGRTAVFQFRMVVIVEY